MATVSAEVLTGQGVPGSVLDEYCYAPPGPQNALDIFAGEWSCRLPPPFEQLRAGHAPLFRDLRIEWAAQALGGVQGQRVLELGPLEGGHSYLLEQLGAASVLAIEANARAFLKCLIVKEIVPLTRTKFLCGDFLEYLRRDPPRFDLALACGVLYHLRQPAALIRWLARITDRLIVWTHYYDEAAIQAAPRLRARFSAGAVAEEDGFRYQVYRQRYGEALRSIGYCGGSADHSSWMTRTDVLTCLRYFGFDNVQIHREEPGHANGPCFLLAAQRTAG